MIRIPSYLVFPFPLVIVAKLIEDVEVYVCEAISLVQTVFFFKIGQLPKKVIHALEGTIK